MTICLCANYPGADDDSCSCCGAPARVQGKPGTPCPTDRDHQPANTREEHRARVREEHQARVREARAARVAAE